MKVLFVCSGNKKEGIGVIVKNQGDSLIKAGIELSYYSISGKGIKGYLKSVYLLRRHLSANSYNIVHAHYSLSAFVASLAFANPLVVSLMGSDSYAIFPWNQFIRAFKFLFWKATIVKTKGMQEFLKLQKCHVVPNGVDIDRFKPFEQEKAKQILGFSLNKKYVIFVADPTRPEKNFRLAQETVEKLNADNIELIPVYDISNDMVPIYMNAADALLLTSLYEGSVNVVKEAMACNLPCVTTDVGDIAENAQGAVGYYISDPLPENLAEKLREALQIGHSAKGREIIISKGLDSLSIAKKIIAIYNNHKKN